MSAAAFGAEKSAPGPPAQLKIFQKLTIIFANILLIVRNHFEKNAKNFSLLRYLADSCRFILLPGT